MAWFAALSMAAVAFGAQAAPAADEWKTYRYPQDRFAADFPIPPTPQDQKPDPQRMVRHNQYWSDKGDIAFGVSAALFHHKIIASETPDKHLQGVIERVRTSLECAIRNQREVSFPGAKAREVVFEKCQKIDGGVAKQRMFLAGDWLYQVMMLSSKLGTEDNAETKRFLQSFSITAR